MLAYPARCEFDVERGPDWLWIRIRGVEACSAQHAPLAEQIFSLAQKHFIYRIVLDLHRAQQINSHVIGELIELSRQIREHDGVLRICGLSPENRQLLETCCVDDLCLAYETREEAVFGSCDPRLPR